MMEYNVIVCAKWDEADDGTELTFKVFANSSLHAAEKALMEMRDQEMGDKPEVRLDPFHNGEILSISVLSLGE